MPRLDESALALPARAPAPSRHGRWQLPELVTAAHAGAPQAERNLWLLHALRWLAHDAPARNAQGTPLAVLRLRQALALLERDPALAAEVGLLLHRLWFEADVAALFADFGFSARRGFGATLVARLLRRWLPPSPDTPDGATLFWLANEAMADAGWMAEIDDETLLRLATLVAKAAPAGSASEPLAPLAQALRWLAATTHAAALAPALRSRLDPVAMAARPFEQLAGAVESLLDARASAAGPRQAANYLRALLQHCRDAAAGVQEHLRAHGVSADLVLEQEQLQLRLDRLEALTDVLVAPQPAAEGARLLARLSAAQREERGLRAQLAWQHRLLARKLSERHALAGEHYVARDGAEYRQLLDQAAGGGAVVAFTTLAKFGLLALGLAPFWSGMAAGVNYAASFLLIYLLHGSLATKQPAMTAAALAARAGELQAEHGSVRAAEGFVDEIAALMRSQLASVIGNLGLVVPVMAGLQGLAWWWAGRPLIGDETAHHVLSSLSLLGPTPLYAAFTGVLLFAGSVAGGWVENAFAFHQTASALAHHPRLVARLGAARTQRWAQWWRRHINGLASNAALGLMLGLAPVLLAFVGLPLDVRHVTLSAGQLTAAVATLGWDTLATPAFWWCAAGIVAIGALNLGVSFALALRLALRARRIDVGDRRLLRRALLRRLARRPLEFLFPPPARA